MNPYRAWFTSYTPLETPLLVYMRDNDQQVAKGKGTFCIKLAPSHITTIANVIHVP